VTADPLVTIVINNYNYARFLGRAVSSALGQNYKAIEVIVVDDGSTDDSAAVLDDYRERCTIIVQPNRGQGAAYNRGFAASRGDAVLFLDADDALYPDAIATAVAEWQDDVAKVQFYLDIVDADERPLGRRKPNLRFMPGREGALIRQYGYYPSPFASGNLYARRVLERILPLAEERWRKGADGYTISLAALYGRVVSIDRALGLYRDHGGNQSETGGITLALVHRRIGNELDREAALKAHAKALGRPIDHALCLSIPQHCKSRLLSLILEPDAHPVKDDKVVPLVLAAWSASWRFPHSRLRKRLLSTVFFLVLPLVPRPWLRRNLTMLFRAELRPGAPLWTASTT
jgi:glycosyltransferase involved in cell wall biosynthesis